MTRHRTRTLPGLLFLAVLIGLPAAGCAAHPPARHHVVVKHQAAATYHVHKAPPAPRREVVVAKPGRGHVWVAGHYVWQPARQSYVWVAGEWVKPPRRGAVWVAPRTERRHGGWVFVAGYWR